MMQYGDILHLHHKATYRVAEHLQTGTERNSSSCLVSRATSCMFEKHVGIRFP